MNGKQLRHGGLTLLAISALDVAAARSATPPADHLILQARSRQIDVAYDVNEAARPLSSVELWYTFDEGNTWHNYGRDEDMVSPVTFVAPQEGLCGLYFIITNAAGASAPLPAGHSEPHMWMFVDYTPPVTQLHPPQFVEATGGQTVARFRWTALDDHLLSRPVELAYRLLPDGPWMDVARRLPNSGRFDWRIPPGVEGRIMFRITVRDRGGHSVSSATGAVDLNQSTPGDPAESDGQFTAQDVASGEAPVHMPTVAEKRRARELFRKGVWHQIRDEQELAVARFRDALKLDPAAPDALVRLGRSLYALERYQEAIRAYELSLRQQPTDRDAQIELAKALIALKRYEAAEERLLAIVEKDPTDAEVWLQLGDVAIYRGLEIEARGYYVKAASESPGTEEVAARARARLDDLALLGRRYGESKSR